jgi:nitrite reductase/ring-hydroxylating ferredoxin subunit
VSEERPPSAAEGRRSASRPKAAAVRVARVGEIAPGRSKKFVLRAGRFDVECFVVNWKGALHAYVNRCRHVTMSLDWVENRFFDETGDLLLCPTHGACYQPDTGECVFGPPVGKRLVRVPLEVRGEEVWAVPPDDYEDVI